MFCPKCGTQNPDGAQLCRSCSWVLTSTSTTAQSQYAKTSGLAIAALVLAVLSPFTCLLTVIPAVICGIVALVRIEKSAGQLKGKGFAIAGIAAPAIIAPVALMMGILMPVLGRTRELAQQTVCASHLHQVSLVIRMYSDDNDGQYPTPAKWCDLLIEHDYINGKQLRCPGAKEGPCNYAMNKNIERLGPAAPPDMVLLFETHPGWNQSGGPEILTTENHVRDGCNIVFVDAHTRFVRQKDLEDLRWTAQQNE